MTADFILDYAIDELLSTPVGKKLEQAMNAVMAVQRGLQALSGNGDGVSLNLLRIGTVFQIFFIDVLASGKRANELTAEDWKNIAEKVSRYAICEDGQAYSEFVFTLYADYICISVAKWTGKAREESLDAISEIADTIRHKTELLRKEVITEVAYVEDCLWLSLEAMIKLLAASLNPKIGPEFTQLAEAVSQLAFEYGRYVLYAKEQAILETYLQNQRVLDEELENEYAAYLAAVQEHAARFQSLVDNAFSVNLHDSLLQTAALAREAGVPEEELLTSMEDVDAFFLD